MKQCLACGSLVARGSYCPAHARGGSSRAWRNLRSRVLARDGHRCRIGLEGCTGIATQVDHVVAVANGGTDKESNLVSSCASCNLRKGKR